MVLCVFKAKERQIETEIKENQPKNFEPVLSHGDFCLPNVFFNDDEFSGLIDLGGTGVGAGTLFNLCNRYLDVKSYDELVSLAEKGDIGKIDLLASIQQAEAQSIIPKVQHIQVCPAN